jgi:GTP-binding protein YchF
MKIGIIGFNQTGKTSLFDLLTGKDSAGLAGGGRGAPNVGTCFIPDERVDFLSGLIKPKKTIYAKIELTDVAGFSSSGDGRSSGAARFLNDVRPCDALVHVLRAFESGSVAHDMGSVDPARDLALIEDEMLLADLEMIEKRIARIKEGKKITKEQATEAELLERCFSHLERSGTVKDMGLTEDERAAVKNFSFLTAKPRLVVVNVDEAQFQSGSYPSKDALLQKLSPSAEEHTSLIGLQAKLALDICIASELEISRLPEDDRQLFMEDLGIEQSGVAVLARAAYEILDLISFLTYVGNEVRAWPLENGTAAKEAAGKIHSDIKRGFIRAEVIKYDDLLNLGSIVKVKEKGLFRLEGSDYTVADGDIINFRFNV